jgi:hypothetical protein|tara:strand:+ start:6077 stop:6274 length:198 start_codon:yes stop_codon:yes gene_type:complete
MKKILITITALLLLAGCSVPKSPALSFGKKCSVSDGGQIAYSYLWIYNKSEGLEADKETCEQLQE